MCLSAHLSHTHGSTEVRSTVIMVIHGQWLSIEQSGAAVSKKNKADLREKHVNVLFFDKTKRFEQGGI